MPDWFDLLTAFALGLVEGLTEFLPVSSDGHLLLMQHFLGSGGQKFGTAFLLVMRVAALVALISSYAARLGLLGTRMFADPAARRFVAGLGLAFLPAAIAGALAHDLIIVALLNLWVVCFALIIGGTVLLWVDQIESKPRYNDAAGFRLRDYLFIGLAQSLALIPGLSRSAVSIVAALLLGADRRAAAEFSLWLAIPALTGAVAYDVHNRMDQFSPLDPIVVSFAVATVFVSVHFVVRALPDYVASRGLRLFAWWRVIVGSLGLIALAIVG